MYEIEIECENKGVREYARGIVITYYIRFYDRIIKFDYIIKNEFDVYYLFDLDNFLKNCQSLKFCLLNYKSKYIYNQTVKKYLDHRIQFKNIENMELKCNYSIEEILKGK